MSEQHQAGKNQPQPDPGPQRFTTAEPRGAGSNLLLLAIVWLAGGTGVLASCSNDQGRGPNSEMRVDAPAASAETKAPGRAEVAPTDPPEPIDALTGAGRIYRVAVGTAYFFDKPEQSVPSGRYLRRGDAFYGEGETNGFVKTGFKLKNGTTGTAWLKRQELRQLAESPGARPVRRKAPTPVPQPGADAGYGPEPSGPGPREKSPAGLPGSATAVVQVGRSYFYNSPDLAVPRKAYCERGDKVRLGESRGEAVYVTFTNWEKVTTTGWMKQATLRTVNP